MPKIIAREPAAIIARTKSKDVKFVIAQAAKYVPAPRPPYARLTRPIGL
jgi:hypothetical protein